MSCYIRGPTCHNPIYKINLLSIYGNHKLLGCFGNWLLAILVGLFDQLKMVAVFIGF